MTGREFRNAFFSCADCKATDCTLTQRGTAFLCTGCLNKDGKGPLRVTVCSECLKASCFQGTWTCEKARSASTIEKTVGELRELALEAESYWGLPPRGRVG